MLWRTEWQVRKSGRLKGEVMPHVHNILFEGRFIPKETVNRAWCSAIGWDGYCRTEIKQARDVGNCGRYASKYVTAVEDLSLVVASYLSRVQGRPWGIKRQQLVPWCLERALEDVPPRVVIEAWKRAQRRYAPIGQMTSGGFTLMGEDVHRLFDALEELL